MDRTAGATEGSQRGVADAEQICFRCQDEQLWTPRLRHTFSDNYLRGNPDDLRGLAALLGHTNLNTVMIYTEPSFDDLAERVERMQ